VTVRFVASALLVLLVATSAHADPQADEKAKAAANAGAALFQKDDFKGAATKFEEAYSINRDPSYLFNIAQAYRHGGDCVRAADYYKRFLEAVPHPPNEEKIRVWYSSQMQCAKEKSAGTEPPKPDEPKPDEPKPDEPKPDEPIKVTPAPHPAPSGRHRRGLAIALAGNSIAAFAVGGFFTWDAGYLSDRRAAFLDRCSAVNRCSSAVVNDYDRRGSRARTLAIVGFAVGGVALAASATLYLMSGSTESPPVAITPIEGGAIVTRGFAW
jgi:tetratricopeptide (TPR) repeat protein